MLTVPVGKTKVIVICTTKSEDFPDILNKGDEGYIDRYLENSIIFVRLSDGFIFRLKSTTRVKVVE